MLWWNTAITFWSLIVCQNELAAQLCMEYAEDAQMLKSGEAATFDQMKQVRTTIPGTFCAVYVIMTIQQTFDLSVLNKYDKNSIEQIE